MSERACVSVCRQRPCIIDQHGEDGLQHQEEAWLRLQTLRSGQAPRVRPEMDDQGSQASGQDWGGGNADGSAFDDGESGERVPVWGGDDEEPEVRLTREQLINHLARRRSKFRYLASLPYTLCLLVVYTAALFAHMDIGTVHDVSKGITEPLLALEFGMSPRKTFVDVRSTEDFWGWLDEAMVPALFNLTAAEENEVLAVVNGVPIYASSVRVVPAISAQAVSVISVTAPTRTFLGIQSFQEMGYREGDTVVVAGPTCSCPNTYTVESVATTKLVVLESVFASEATPGDCLISRPAVSDPRTQLPSRKAVSSVQQYNMVVGGVTIKKIRAYEIPCADADASHLFYTEKGEGLPCYPEDMVRSMRSPLFGFRLLMADVCRAARMD